MVQKEQPERFPSWQQPAAVQLRTIIEPPALATELPQVPFAMSQIVMKRFETHSMQPLEVHLAVLFERACCALQPPKCSSGWRSQNQLLLAAFVTAFPQKQALKVLQNAVIQKEDSKTKRVTYGLLEHALVAIMRIIRVR